jgi:hypothetical protein
MNMEISLILAHLCLLLPALYDYPWPCRILSILIHYFFTSAFMFMFLESLHVYAQVSKEKTRSWTSCIRTFHSYKTRTGSVCDLTVPVSNVTGTVSNLSDPASEITAPVNNLTGPVNILTRLVI